MKEQFSPSDWRLQLENWPFWMPSPLNGAPAPWDQIGRQNTLRPAVNPSGGLLGGLTQQSGGLLSSLVQPANDMAANGPSSGSNLPHPMSFAQAVNRPATPRSEPELRNTSAADTADQSLPQVPFYSPGELVFRPKPEPPSPPKDFWASLGDALSVENTRYYLGPHAFETLRKAALLAGLLLPGSGTVQASKDSARASEEARAGNYGQAAADIGMGTLNAALDWLPPAKLAIIGGTMARTFPRNKLPTAMEMEAAGKSADEIWRATGLERAADERWTFEIPDTGYQVHPNAGVPLRRGSFRDAPLYEQHAHPGMREAYPDLGNFPSLLAVGPREPTRGMTFPNYMEVRAPNPEAARYLGIHELKHVIDNFEKHPPAGSPRDLMERGIPMRKAYDLYRTLIAEVAARNAQRRLLMSEQERRLRSPQSTEDVPRDQQINLYDDDRWRWLSRGQLRPDGD